MRKDESRCVPHGMLSQKGAISDLSAQGIAATPASPGSFIDEPRPSADSLARFFVPHTLLNGLRVRSLEVMEVVDDCTIQEGRELRARAEEAQVQIPVSPAPRPLLVPPVHSLEGDATHGEIHSHQLARPRVQEPCHGSWKTDSEPYPSAVSPETRPRDGTEKPLQSPAAYQRTVHFRRELRPEFHATPAQDLSP